MEDNEKLIEEMINEAEKAAEPGELKRGQVINSGDEDMPAPMVAMKLKSAGYVYIYDNRTGDRSLCNRNMLLQALKKKRPDGSTVFTTAKPSIEPKQGHFKCLLHQDNPNRKHYDELGLAVCKKANLISPYQVRRHMEKRHKMEWATIEQERIDTEKREDREFQRQIMTKATGGAPLYVSKKDRAKLEAVKAGE